MLDGLEERGLEVRPLACVLGRPVMEPVDQGQADPGARCAAAFYDGLAGTYDLEQESAGAAPVRRAEKRLIAHGLERLLAEGDRVLELGAGTGRFTLALARRAGSVTALDISPAMLAQLEARIRDAGLDNVTLLRGAAEDAPLQGNYQLICSFSALEYVPRLEPLLERLAQLLEPGGHLFITTAHRGPLRFFVQLGNALRQGMWLHARSRGQIRRALRSAGLELLVMETHGLRLPLLGGMLLEVVARKKLRVES